MRDLASACALIVAATVAVIVVLPLRAVAYVAVVLDNISLGLPARYGLRSGKSR